MSWPSPPYPFGTATSPEPMASLDTMFNQVGAMVSIPCTPSGTNAIALTPNVNCPALSSYNDLGSYRFVALGTSTGLVTAQYNGLGFLPVYHADGVTQAGTADVVIGQQYIFTFHSTLNGGLGGFYFEAPSQPNPTLAWFTPGGRLTTQSAVPVNFTSAAPTGTIYYAPYVHPFVPLFNGSAVQMYQFSTPLNDHIGLILNMNGSAIFPSGAVFDIFMILNAGVLTLAALQWTNTTTRAMTLSIFGGFLTNSGATNMLISPAGTPSTVAVAANQATFLGSFYTSANGLVTWQFPGNVTAGIFGLSNYYNTVLFTGFVQDTGSSYTYAGNTVRQAGARTYNQITILQTSSERAMNFSYYGGVVTAAVNGSTAFLGMGFDTITAFVSPMVFQGQSAAIAASRMNALLLVSATGLHVTSANELGDGTNANTFNSSNNNQLGFRSWL
jgi:hypothetical protein